MFMKNFLGGTICLTLVIIQKIQSFFDETNKKVIGKMKDEFDEVIVEEFVGLKSKMYSIKKNEFNKFKDVLFGKKKLLDTK